MPDTLKRIKSPISKHLNEFETFFYKTMKSNVPLLDRILKYLVKRKGKQMRPLFVLLSAACNGEINEKTYRAASLIELLHTATLIHDDVTDDSYERRGMFSINALWKNKTAVLVGDYLLSRGMLLALTNKDNEFLEITSDAVRLMSEGELLQIEKARTLDIEEEVYFEIIKMKTASLIASSCALGAASVNASKEDVEMMRQFGEYIGIAFQIKDDLLDYSTNIIGKPKGVDIKEKKLTLPLIYSLKQVDNRTRKHVINLVSRSKNQNKNIIEIIDFVKNNKGFEYTKDKMFYYKDKALEVIDKYPENEYKESLTSLVNYTIDRTI